MRRIVLLALVIALSFLAGAMWFRHQLPPFQQAREAYLAFRPPAPAQQPPRPDKLIEFKLPATGSPGMKRLTTFYDQLRAAAFSQTPKVSLLEEETGDSFGVEAERTQVYRAQMAFGCTSDIHLFFPELQSNPRNSLFIFHQGHGGPWTPNTHLIRALLAAGFHVAAFEMPFSANFDGASKGRNCDFSYDDRVLGEIGIYAHSSFLVAQNFTEQTGIHPLSFFLAPLKAFVDYAEDELSLGSFQMAGISGGGLTITVYGALDRRIAKAFSVAGDMPYTWRIMVRSRGDFEQYEVLKFGTYFELYMLDIYDGEGFTREKFNLYNAFDDCCFKSYQFDLASLQNAVNRAISQVSGEPETDKFRIIEFENDKHSITDEMVTFIVKHAGE